MLNSKVGKFPSSLVSFTRRLWKLWRLFGRLGVFAYVSARHGVPIIALWQLWQTWIGMKNVRHWETRTARDCFSHHAEICWMTLILSCRHVTALHLILKQQKQSTHQGSPHKSHGSLRSSLKCRCGAFSLMVSGSPSSLRFFDQPRCSDGYMHSKPSWTLCF